MRILVSNDDGVYSPGIHALARVAQDYGDVRVVAPDVEQSAMGHAITVRRPLHYHRTRIDGLEAFRVDGTPADAVALGAHHWDKVDLVLSGINLGLNIGHNIRHSGTVSAAMQAAFLSIPAIAFSGPIERRPRRLRRVRAISPSGDRALPRTRRPAAAQRELPAQPRGLRWTRQSVRHYDGYVIPGEDPMGRTHYWFGEEPREQVETGTDRWAIEQGYVSLTPLRLDVTDDQRLERVLRKLQDR
jgi:5'-nucleotidase